MSVLAVNVSLSSLFLPPEYGGTVVTPNGSTTINDSLSGIYATFALHGFSTSGWQFTASPTVTPISLDAYAKLSSPGVGGVGPINPTYYVASTGNDGTTHTGTISDPLATPQEACRRLGASRWSGSSPPLVIIVDVIALGANPRLNVPTPSDGSQPVQFQSLTYTDSGLGTRTASGGAAPVASNPPQLGTVIDGAGGLTAHAWVGYYLRWTSGANIGLRAAIVDNSTTTFTLSSGYIGATASLDTYVVEKPSGAFTFSGKFALIGDQLIINGLTFTGLGSSPTLANNVKVYLEYGVRYVPPTGGMSLFFGCGSYVSGNFYTYAYYSPFPAVLPTDLAPSQYLGSLSNPLNCDFSGVAGASGGGTTLHSGANLQGVNLFTSNGAAYISRFGSFNNGSMYSAYGSEISTLWLVVTGAVIDSAPACFYADSASVQSHYEAYVNGVTGGVAIFGSGSGGVMGMNLVYGSCPSASYAYQQQPGGKIISAECLLTDATGTSSIAMYGSVPIISYNDISVAGGTMPAQLPAQIYMIAGRNTTSGPATAVIVTAPLAPYTTGRISSYYLECVFVGYRTDIGGVGNTFSTKLRCCYKNVAGTPVQVGSDSSGVAAETFNDAAEAGCTFSSAVTSQSIQFKATTPGGFAGGHNIRWTAVVTVTMGAGY